MLFDFKQTTKNLKPSSKAAHFFSFFIYTVIFFIFSTQTSRAFGSYPTDNSAGPGQPDRISGGYGAAALPFSWRHLSQDLMGERWREAAGK